MKRPALKRAFTLIELLMVVAIIAIISAVVLTSLSGARVKSRDAKRVSDVAQLQLALEQYFDRCGQYPNEINDTAASNCNASGITFATFISKIPTPPSITAAYDYMTGGNPPTDYIVHSKLEGTSDALKDSLTDTYRASFASTYATSLGGNNTSFNCNAGTNSTDYCLGPK